MTVVQVSAPHFTAGLVVGPDGIVSDAAPILAWAKGKLLLDVQAYCFERGWETMAISTGDI